MGAPTSVAEVRSFLGLASYYRKFVEGFATIASPLHDLLRKNSKFVWTDTCQEAFSTLKERLTRAPVLAYPEGEGQFILDTDASGYGIGAVLSQVQEGQEKVIAYASKALNKSQRRYCTTSLQWLLNFRDAENMLARWLTVLTAYSFEIVHRKGTKHGNADALSRKPRRCKCDSCPDCKSTELVAPARDVRSHVIHVALKSACRREAPRISNNLLLVDKIQCTNSLPLLAFYKFLYLCKLSTISEGELADFVYLLRSINPFLTIKLREMPMRL